MASDINDTDTSKDSQSGNTSTLAPMLVTFRPSMQVIASGRKMLIFNHEIRITNN